MSGQENSTPHLPDDYDGKIRSVIPYYDELHREVLGLIHSYEPSPSIWLDTGCGTGTLVERAIAMFPETTFFLADPSEGMLVQARAKMGGNMKVKILAPSSTQTLTGIEEGSLDVITAIQCHHYHSPAHRSIAIETCHRLLRKGGMLVTTENIRPLTKEGVDIGKGYWAQYQRGYGRSKDEIESHLSRFDKEYFPITVEEHLSLLRSRGFAVVEMFWYSYMQAGFYAIK